MTLPLFLAIALVLGMGFAAHRASLCTVRAVMEIMLSGRAKMLVSFVKAVLWTMMVSGSLITIFSITPLPVLERVPFGAALAGGFIFGIGAAINGGCSFSTLQRLADGQLGMGFALLGMILGFLGMNQLLTVLPGTSLQPIVPLRHWQGSGSIALLGTLWIWAIWELRRIYRGHGNGADLARRLLADKYRLSSAAAVLGIGGGMLYAIQGAWTYTNFLRAESATWLGSGPAPLSGQGQLLAALIAGMLLSSWHRGNLRISLPKIVELGPRLTGGFLMGVGGSLVPGGNDTLLLAAIPTLSLQAVAAYGALLAGVACTLALMRRKIAPVEESNCSGDRCH